MTTLRIVVLGLSLSSSWGNGHATTYRALLKALAARGHDILFLERDVPWYAEHRDFAETSYCRLAFYGSLAELPKWKNVIADADVTIVGSYVPDGVAVGRLVQSWSSAAAFYDIDTPITLAQLARGRCEYVSAALIPGYKVYLSFTGGPTLRRIEHEYGAPVARALYCSVDPELYQPPPHVKRWDLSYLGTYSVDRQPVLETLLIEPARRLPEKCFVVAGPLYPTGIEWPANIERIDHVAPSGHADFYASSVFTLNVTRADMVQAGWSPSVRLFEAGACATPVISDRWEGLDTLLTPEHEIILAETSDRVVDVLTSSEDIGFAPDRIGRNAQARILAEHTSAHRAAELEIHLSEALGRI